MNQEIEIGTPSMTTEDTMHPASNNVFHSSKTSEWGTPQDLFDSLNAEFQFDLDVCASHENAKCALYMTQEEDGLVQCWGSYRVWCNPPYGRGIAPWIRKCIEHGSAGNLAVMLLPARTDTKWYHDLLWDNQKHVPRDPVKEVRFVKGRLKFGSSSNSAPFPSLVVVIGG